MKYMIGMVDTGCYIDMNGEVHIPFETQTIQRAKEVIARMKKWPDGAYTYFPDDAYAVLYGRIAESEERNRFLKEENYLLVEALHH